MSATDLLDPPVAHHGGESLRASAIDWPHYRQLLEIFEGRRLRITYDRGELEIRTVSPRHERFKGLLARMLESLAVAFDIPLQSLGNMTCSLACPKLRLERIAEALRKRGAVGDTQIVREFVEVVRQDGGL